MLPNNDLPKFFSSPVRQSSLGILVETAIGLQNFVKVIWPLLIYLFIKDSSLSPWVTGLVIIIVLSLYLLFGYLKYKNFVFYFKDDSGEFILESGIFNKKKVSIRLDRIQQVNISQGFIQKILNVYAVEINTAGTAKSEVKIRTVSHETALQLKDRLLEGTTPESTPPPASSVLSKPYLQLGISSLARIAITSNYGKSFAVIIALLGALYNYFRDLFPGYEKTVESFFNTFHFSSIFPYLGIAIIVAFTFLFIFNLIRVLITYSNYQIQFKQSAFSISYGLLQTKNILLYTGKVQIVRTVTNFFQRKMNLCRVIFYQASSDVARDTQSVIPVWGCTFQQKNELLRKIFQKLPPEKLTLRPNRRKAIPGVFFLIIVPLFIGGLGIYSSWFSIFISIIPFWLVLAAMIIWFQMKNNKLKAGDGFLQVTEGVWDITTSMLETYKIQAISVRQQLWHRRANIGNIKIHTAGGIISFKYGDYDKINTLVNQWLVDVESSQKDWM